MFAEPLARMVGAKPHEVVAMNGLTVNLHLLMASFYRPSGNRYKILCEAKAFPSDQYAIQSRLQLSGYLPDDALIEVAPRPREHLIRDEDIIETIAQNGSQLALVMLGGVNYYTGQVFDIRAITRAAHEAGALCGWDLAHAAGNIPLQLHDDQVDFAAWCSYKYLNSGPGSVAAAFIHQKHARNAEMPRMAGWWGHDKSERFKMDRHYRAIPTAEGWQLSNAPVFSMAPLKASLDIFEEAGGIQTLRRKSLLLAAFLQKSIVEVSVQTGVSLEIITPAQPVQRGCQISMLVHNTDGRAVFDYLSQHGVMADWREPNVIRMAPVPLYNNFEDVYRFMVVLHDALEAVKSGKYVE
jgi:kynureninase